MMEAEEQPCEECGVLVEVNHALIGIGTYTLYYFCSETCFENYNNEQKALGMPELER